MLIYKKLVISGLIIGFTLLTVYGWTSMGVHNTDGVNDILSCLVVLGIAGGSLAGYIRINLSFEDDTTVE